VHVIVVDTFRRDREQATAILSGVGHDVVPAADAKEAVAILDRTMVDAVVIAWATPGAVELVRHLRALESDAHVFIVATGAGRAPREHHAAIAAGADDYLRTPLCTDELVIRVGAATRIAAWARKVHGPRAPEVASGLIRTLAWREAGRVIGADYEGMLGESVAVASCDAAHERASVGAQISLVMAEHGVEIHITVGVDAASKAALAQRLLGDEHAPAEAIGDMMRELTNTAGGAFKQAALQEQIALTTGLPTDVDEATVPSSSFFARQDLRATSADGAIDLDLVIELRAKDLSRVHVASLAEGMVLATDLLSDQGVLLIPNGTRLTRALIARVAGLLSPKTVVEVADAALGRARADADRIRRNAHEARRTDFGGPLHTRLRPSRFASYIAASARSVSVPTESPVTYEATPNDAVTGMRSPCSLRTSRRSISTLRRSATAAAAWLPVSGRTATSSSPPQRAGMSAPRR
jgi:DNA-binding response OmpR family regulator